MVSFPPCKINLGLHILRKRPDGYHDIDTCFYPLPLTDILEVIPSPNLQFSCSGDRIPGDQTNNLCLKAYELLKKEFEIPSVRIHLHKIIPTGAGLGGGSSDAAHTLRLLDEIFSLNLGKAELMRYASFLGSDCSFFIQDIPMVGSGRGEILGDIRLSLKGYFLVLLNPAIHVSTADAYASVTPRIPEQSLSTILQQPVTQWRTLLVNDFESSVFVRYPEIEMLKNELYKLGALYSSMSGSGSSVFGIFHQLPEIDSKIASMIVWQGQLTN